MDTEAQVESFIAKFTDEVAGQIRAARAEMRRRLPGALELVYDNYNALAIGYASSEKLEDVVFSLACFPKYVRLFFYRGAELDDPDELLEGEGSQARSILLSSLSRLDEPGIASLMAQALGRMKRPIDPAALSRTVVKSISAKQRPRRPA